MRGMEMTVTASHKSSRDPLPVAYYIHDRAYCDKVVRGPYTGIQRPTRLKGMGKTWPRPGSVSDINARRLADDECARLNARDQAEDAA